MVNRKSRATAEKGGGSADAAAQGAASRPAKKQKATASTGGGAVADPSKVPEADTAVPVEEVSTEQKLDDSSPVVSDEKAAKGAEVAAVSGAARGGRGRGRGRGKYVSARAEQDGEVSPGGEAEVQGARGGQRGAKRGSQGGRGSGRSAAKGREEEKEDVIKGEEMVETKGSTPKKSRTSKKVEKPVEEAEKEVAETVKGEGEGGGGSKSKAPKITKAAAAKAAAEASAAAAKSKEPWTILIHRKAEPHWEPYNPSTMRRTPVPKEGQKVHKLISWNVNGLRALVAVKGEAKGKGKETAAKGKKKGGKKSMDDGEGEGEGMGGGVETGEGAKGEESALGGKGEGEGETVLKGAAAELHSLAEMAEREKPDVICIQETKLQEKDVQIIKEGLLPDYQHSFWSCSTAKLGYSGCALFSKVAPVSVTYGLGHPDHDTEGRVITAEFEKFYLVGTYVPNASEDLKRLPYRENEWDPALAAHLKKLEQKKPVILAGDLNVAHQEIDIYHPEGNQRSAGFTEEERRSFQKQLLDRSFVDTFRQQHPHRVAYTYWAYRSGARPKNAGWRLDYFIASPSLLEDSNYDSFTLPDVPRSDHCPIGFTFCA